VFGVQELYDVIVSARAEKRVVACVNSLAASAAYWLACAANEMVVTPGGQVGSVGVYMMHADVSKKMEMEGVKTTFVQAGAFKTEGNPFEPLSAEARAAIQEQVDAYYGMFVKAVAGGRGVAQSAVRDGFGQGRMVMAAEAVKMGMADRVATLDATLGRLLMKGARAGGDKTARMTTRDLEALLRDGAGLSHSKAKKLASLAYEPDHASGTEDEEPAPATSTDGMDQETREALREFIAVMQD
jgi:signal peptide peptidase SppA